MLAACPCICWVCAPIWAVLDYIDEFWIPAIGKFQDKPLKSVTRGGADLAKIARPDGEAAKSETTAPGVDRHVAMFRLTLKEAV
jgi:molecular chaperone HtpG